MPKLVETTSIERGAYLAQLLIGGKQLTAAEAANMLGVSTRTARRDFNAISRVIAIYRDHDGNWRLCENGHSLISPY